ncbi:DUF4153 domain-containing protein [Pseudomonas sp. 3A(2025)]
MSPPHKQYKQSLSLYLGIGLVQSLLLAIAVHGEWAWLAAGGMVLVLNLQLLGREALQRRVWLWSVLLALLIAQVTAWAWHSSPDEAYDPSWSMTSWVLAGTLTTYIVTAFILGWPSGERWRVPYEALFRHAWNNAFIVLLALLLMGLFWSLLQLCASLFEMIGITQLKQAIDNQYVIILCLSLVFSLGMRMGRDNERVIGMLRGILLSLCHFLAPLAALIVLLFSLSLPFTGLESIWKTGHATAILLSLVAVAVFLVNGVFQDGRQGCPYPRWLRWLVDTSLVCLPVLTVLAGYSTWLRVSQYGLSPSRFIAALMVVVAALYSLAALYAVLRNRAQWLGSLRVSNPCLALLVCIVLLAIHSPWFNAQALSARNQVQRLLDGRTSPVLFDADYLYWKLGDAGRRQLEWLSSNLDQQPQWDAATREVIRTRLDDGRDARLRQRPVTEINRVWIGTPVEGHEQFANPKLGSLDCNRLQCTLWAVDLSGDGRDEVLRFTASGAQIEFYRRTDEGRWVLAGYLQGGYETRDLADLIRQGKAKIVAPRYRNLQIDDQTYMPYEVQE